MSLAGAESDQVSSCFPRVSGDEPLAADKAEAKAMFSPRERG